MQTRDSHPLSIEAHASLTELIHYKEMFEYAPIGIIRTTIDGKILEINPAMVQMLGYGPNETAIVGHIVQDFYAEPEKRRQLMADALHHGQLVSYENQFRRKDKTTITCMLQIRVVKDKSGKACVLESFVEDITGRKKTAEALAESERLYRGIFENTGAGTIIIEPDMVISFANSGFMKMTGYSREEIEGRMKWTTIIADPADLKTMINYHTSRRSSSGPPIEYEFVLVDKAGERKNIFLRVDMIAGTNRSVASLLDITALKRARRSIANNEVTLKGLLEVFDGFIYTTNQDYILTSVNESLCKFLGRNVTGEKCYKTIFGISEPCVWCSHDRVFSGESVKAEFENPRNNRWYHMVSTPVFAGDETIHAKQSIMMDIHHRKQEEIAAKDREEYLRKENIRLRDSIQDRYRFGDIIGKSIIMQKVYELILRASLLDANVIIHGESGTGKELVAKAVHSMSDRSRYPFIPVNCGAIPEHLFESEFFGYKKGAFTGANHDKPGYFDLADKGTLFLDELGEISLEMQVKLLRVLEGHSYHPVGGIMSHNPDVRIITATNKNLHELIDKGQMREDFFYRIHIIPIHIPPLRQRKEDIPLLVEHFMEKYKTPGKHIPQIMGNIMDTMTGYDWPGNVRELENTIQRYMSLQTLDFFYAKSIPARTPGLGKVIPDMPLKSAMDRYEKEYISSLLQQNQWNRTKVAKILGIERKTLYLKMKGLNVSQT